ncbi:uncharacterized protein LOC133178391 [Saccostrea echinata]|uniref:uncharacterized protein LOC133178391 n=1 Tax=Saccostrea echinata TaxID=191078 RepID=UPI002A841AB5|nr:uncharacterized protein LOC133178391 [Saccostrea echinata]XP_061169119.1 uncharacterized protein LOC133178391 [Saccostrea echinata]XP_061169122.1 uncharacterized protein LOC133178391 [Saccostrea echinata]
MNLLVVLAAVVVGALASPIKRGHWDDAYGADNEDVAALSEDDFQKYRLLLLKDLGGLDYLVSSLLNPKLKEELQKAYGHVVFMSIHGLMSLADSAEKDADPESKPQAKECDDKSNLPTTMEECKRSFGYMLWGIRENIREAVAVLYDDKESRQEKLKAVKGFVDKIAGKGPCVLGLADHCYVKKEVSRELSGEEAIEEKAKRLLDTFLSGYKRGEGKEAY